MNKKQIWIAPILTGLVICFCSLLKPLPQQAFPETKFRAVAMYENGGHHVQYSAAAILWLNQLANDSNFLVDYIQKPDGLDDQFLEKYQLFIQLDYPPYGWGNKAESAFRRWIENGKGGWIGFHHASLLGEFDGYPMWDWFSRFMGGIRFENYIPGFAMATVNVEDGGHPTMKGIPSAFVVDKDEWYVYDHSPRQQVHVICTVDESTYNPRSKIIMGDHPVIWSNEKVKARNIYIFMGHSPDLFMNEAYTAIFKNAIFWAAGQNADLPH
ncbi:MAG: ThuA domain-containing protein [Chitinophagales bacterium]